MGPRQCLMKAEVVVGFIEHTYNLNDFERQVGAFGVLGSLLLEVLSLSDLLLELAKMAVWHLLGPMYPFNEQPDILEDLLGCQAQRHNC